MSDPFAKMTSLHVASTDRQRVLERSLPFGGDGCQRFSDFAENIVDRAAIATVASLCSPIPTLIQGWGRMIGKNHAITGMITCAAMIAAWAVYEFALAARVKPPEKYEVTASGPSVPASCLNFGEVWVDVRFKWVISVENPSTHEARIDGFGSSCTCTQISPNSLTIPPGQTRDLQLTIDLTSKSGQVGRALPDVEEFEVGVHPFAKKEGRQIYLGEWLVKGRVKRVLHLGRRTVDFGKHSDRAQPIAPQQIVATARAPAARLTFDCPSSFVAVEAKPEDTNFVLAIRPRGTLPTGIYAVEIDVTAHPPDINLTVHMVAITDGTSNTVMIGERPAGPDGVCAAWYAGWGSRASGVNLMLDAGVAVRAAKSASVCVASTHTGQSAGRAVAGKFT